jgi:GT2 family glycosyltransferase
MYVFINVGLYRSGSTTFATAVEYGGFQVYRDFPDYLSGNEMKEMLLHPAEAVNRWWQLRGTSDLSCLVDQIKSRKNVPALLGDGWFSLLPFMKEQFVKQLVKYFKDQEMSVHFIATTRDCDSQVQSELHHWIIHDLEKRNKLSIKERSILECCLRSRCQNHTKKLKSIVTREEDCFPMELNTIWPILMKDMISKSIPGLNIDWSDCFTRAGHQNKSPSLPLEAILLTLRMNDDVNKTFETINRLLTSLEDDTICRYMLVLAFDADEFESKAKQELGVKLRQNARIEKLEIIKNPSTDATAPFPICAIWNDMACKAFDVGADWVMLLGDDVEIKCKFHYRAIYRAFLDVSTTHQLPFGFGAPWWNDESFPGFPTFPVIGRVHHQIFNSLIPHERKHDFVNQDLDPYLQRLYLQFASAPILNDVRLINTNGGSHLNPTRYKRVPAIGWRDWVMKDCLQIQSYLENHGHSVPECILMDVVVPTYRINMPILECFCMLVVPPAMRCVLIIIVDNPTKLCNDMNVNDTDIAASLMESMLRAYTLEHKENSVTLLGENVRVRCNTINLGASASRNRGINESSAQYTLFLDDDVKIPKNSHLLNEYYMLLQTKPADCVGFVGLVTFPRQLNLPIIHGAVLMSYLTFMFEIAKNPLYMTPAWGVTANLLVIREEGIRFDINYAKTGGGEDVDFCLRLLEVTGGKLYSAPQAEVYHEFWSGGIMVLCHHFLNWAVGDSALFRRFPEHCYLSYPNVTEFLLVFFLITLSLFALDWVTFPLAVVPLEILLVFTVDFVCDLSDIESFKHRCTLLLSEETKSNDKYSLLYCIGAHFLANMYIIILECGRLYGHILRRDFFTNFTRRFDWHCQRLPNAKENFAQKELVKFQLFVLVTVLNLCSFKNLKIRKH